MRMVANSGLLLVPDRKIGEDLNLKKESVFEEGFWRRFEGYLSRWKVR